MAIVHQAGTENQGVYAIAIGTWAGAHNQAANSIMIAADGGGENIAPASCIIKPIRNLNGPASQRLYYSPAGVPGQVGEITWGTDESSIRYKQNVVDLPLRYVDAVYNLRPVEFEFKSVPDQRRIGLVAEEVAEHMPELVVYNALDDSVIEGLEYEHLIAPLVKIIQDYKSRIDVLENDNKNVYEILENHATMFAQYGARLQALEK